MLQDEHIQEWINEYGGVTSYTYLVYGEIDNRDLMMIQQGLTLRLLHKGHDHMMLFIEEIIDEELANALGHYRGTQINIVFRGDNSDIEELITSTISEGLEYLRLKHDFIGMMGANEYV